MEKKQYFSFTLKSFSYSLILVFILNFLEFIFYIYNNTYSSWRYSKGSFIVDNNIEFSIFNSKWCLLFFIFYNIFFFSLFKKNK